MTSPLFNAGSRQNTCSFNIILPIFPLIYNWLPRSTSPLPQWRGLACLSKWWAGRYSIDPWGSPVTFCMCACIDSCVWENCSPNLIEWTNQWPKSIGWVAWWENPLRDHSALFYLSVNKLTICWARFSINAIFSGIGIPIIKIRRSHDRLIFILGILILVRCQAITGTNVVLDLQYHMTSPGHNRQWVRLQFKKVKDNLRIIYKHPVQVTAGA